MAKVSIIGNPLRNMPWQEKPAGCADVVWRYDQNPVIGRNVLPEAARIYNSAVVPHEGGFAGVFRADQRCGTATLYSGRSGDAIRWTFDPMPIAFVLEDGSPAGPLVYGYDPRVVRIEDIYYITWCNYFNGPTIGVAKTRDFKTFIQIENAFLPFNRNGVLFPRKINGHYVLLSRPSDNGHTPFGDVYLSQSADMTYWGRHRLVMKTSHYWWKSLKVGAGPIPIETTEGWLLIYHGVCLNCSGYVYSIGGALLDLDDPSKVIVDCRNYLMTPEMPYETNGFVANVVFPCAALTDSDTGRIALFYGAADTVSAMAFARVDELVGYIKDHPNQPMNSMQDQRQ